MLTLSLRICRQFTIGSTVLNVGNDVTHLTYSSSSSPTSCGVDVQYETPPHSSVLRLRSCYLPVSHILSDFIHPSISVVAFLASSSPALPFLTIFFRYNLFTYLFLFSSYRLHGRVVKGVGHLGHDEVMEAGGREFDPRPGHYSRMSF